jgi:hypothetical protein
MYKLLVRLTILLEVLLKLYKTQLFQQERHKQLDKQLQIQEIKQDHLQEQHKKLLIGLTQLLKHLWLMTMAVRLLLQLIYLLNQKMTIFQLHFKLEKL